MRFYSIRIASIVPSLLLLEQATTRQVFRHEAAEIMQRQAERPFWSPPAAQISQTQSGEILTFITPSPGATPVAISAQSQLVTSYVPQYTLCELPPLAEVLITAAPIATSTTAPYSNYTVSTPPGNGTCTTIYSPTETMVCATVLSGIATRYTVTDCAQDMTFSSAYGYVLATPSPTGPNATNVTGSSSALTTPAPTIQTLTTYYLAPWQQLTTAGPPGTVDVKVCTTDARNGSAKCVLEYYAWQTTLLTLTMSTVTRIDLTTTVAGPSQLLVETFVANVTELLTTFSLSTTMALQYTLLTETGSMVPRFTSPSPSPPTTTTGATVYETFTVEPAGAASS
ncbi:hypothetical protein MBLNU459_g6629t1 [Dothideomycetes sp. NU459]